MVQNFGKMVLFIKENLKICKNGIGIYIWPDKSKYEGEWCDNCFNGYGIYYYSDNKVYLGEWEMNEKNGFGVFLTNDAIYIGNYENDRKMDLVYFFGGKKMKLIQAFLKMEINMDLENIFLIIKNQSMEFGIMIRIIK